MPRVTYAPVSKGQTVGGSGGLAPRVTTMQPGTPYQLPGPTPQPPSGGMPHPGPVPPTKVSPPVGNPMPHPGPVPPTQTQPPAPQPRPFHPPPVPPTFEPPVRPGGGWTGDAFTPGGGGFVGYGSPFKNFNPNEGVSPHVTPGSGIVSNPLPHPGPVPPTMPPTMPPSPIPEPVGGGGNNAIVGQSATGIAPPVPVGGLPPIPEPTLPQGYNPNGGKGNAGGIVSNTNPTPNPAPNPETDPSTWNNAARAELAPPVGSWTRFSDKGKWAGQDAQAQNIANRKAKKDTNDATPDTGNIITPTVGKKKTGSGATKPPKQGGQNGTPEASGTNKQNGNANKGNGKQGKNAKVTKADKQKAKNRKPQPGTPARPYRNHGVSYQPLGYGGSLRI